MLLGHHEALPTPAKPPVVPAFFLLAHPGIPYRTHFFFLYRNAVVMFADYRLLLADVARMPHPPGTRGTVKNR